MSAVGAAIDGVVSDTFNGIVKTTLYVYATEGTSPDEFGDIDPSTESRSDQSSGTADQGGAI